MALTKITTSVVAVNSLTAANIADNSIDATKIANNQILARHIAADALSDQIADNSITAGMIPNATALTLDGGVTIDNITIDGTEIDLSSGDLTLDVAGDIILDVAGSDVIYKRSGTSVGEIQIGDDNFNIRSLVSDKDIIFKGNDAGTTVTAMTIDMSEGGNVGIGDTSPDKKLHITDTSGNHLRIAYNDSYYFDIGRQASDGRLSITDNVNGEAVAILPTGNVGLGTSSPKALSGQKSLSINASVPRIDFKVGDVFKHHILAEAEYMSIGADADNNQSNSRVVIEADNAVVARFDSDGIKFGADTAAANALNDYEEGTWTPVLNDSGAAITNSGGTTYNWYVKVGKVVHLSAHIVFSAADNSGNPIRITGLPFTNDGKTAVAGSMISRYAGSVGTIAPYITGSTLYFYIVSSQTSWRQIAYNDVGAYSMHMSITYMTT